MLSFCSGSRCAIDLLGHLAWVGSFPACGRLTLLHRARMVLSGESHKSLVLCSGFTPCANFDVDEDKVVSWSRVAISFF